MAGGSGNRTTVITGPVASSVARVNNAMQPPKMPIARVVISSCARASSGAARLGTVRRTLWRDAGALPGAIAASRRDKRACSRARMASRGEAEAASVSSASRMKAAAFTLCSAGGGRAHSRADGGRNRGGASGCEIRPCRTWRVVRGS